MSDGTFDLRLLRFRDGFSLSLAMLEREHADLLHLIRTLKKAQASDALRGIALAWQIIDNVHRVRELAQALPGLGSDPRRTAFIRTTGIVERFRHYVQHLREKLARREIDPFPVWGSFSWIDADDPTTCHVAITGTVINGTHYNTCVYDRELQTWVSKVALSVGGVSFNVDPMVAEA